MALIIAHMPSTANTTSTGNSKRAAFSCSIHLSARISVAAEAPNTISLANTANASVMNRPLKVTWRGPPNISANTAAAANTARAR